MGTIPSLTLSMPGLFLWVAAAGPVSEALWYKKNHTCPTFRNIMKVSAIIYLKMNRYRITIVSLYSFIVFEAWNSTHTQQCSRHDEGK